MRHFPRLIFEEANFLATQFRALAIIGPRQSGKTTLSKELFRDIPYINLEDPAKQIEVQNNIAAFLQSLSSGAILDEVQRVPEIFRYMQQMLDSSKKRRQFVLTGSNNFLLQEQITQSLAGRIGYIQLLPLSYAELKNAGLAPHSLDKIMITGGYPEIWDQRLAREKWMSAYIQTYVQRDVRLIRNISDLGTFTRFIMMCAAHAGMLINREEFSRNLGIDNKTVQSWFSVLESSYIVFLLQPWYNNLNKRIVKAQKLYFHDTGLLCHLLGLHTLTALQKHRMYGHIFENWIISEIVKNRFNNGINDPLYYFRDSAGNEVDLVLEKGGDTIAVEIKSAKKIDSSMLGGLKYWIKNNRHSSGLLFYPGEKHMAINDQVHVLGWKEVADM